MQSPSSFIERARLPISDLAVVSRLYDVGTQCARAGDDFNGCIEAILDAAIFITAADKGSLQLVEAQLKMSRLEVISRHVHPVSLHTR